MSGADRIPAHQTHIRMGTEAHHHLGDISRDEYDFFYVNREDIDNYYGQWLFGLGYINVRFPKATTRALSEAEELHLAEHGRRIANGPGPVIA